MTAADEPTLPKKVPGAESSRKLLQLLLSFTVSTPTWTVADLSANLDMPQSMVYRYVGLLREVGLLDSAGGKSYRVTDLAQSLAEAASVARAPLAEVALPFMTAVRDEIDETVLVSRRSGWYSYCVERVESRQPVRLQFERGQAMSLHSGSMSRLLLASMNENDRESYFSRFSDVIDRDRMPRLSNEALQEISDRGFTESFEEVDEGIWGVAAAITVGGDVIATVGTAAPIYRVDETQRARTTELIIEAAKQISRAMAEESSPGRSR
ncbi:DNA-binding IclR family transcriptional regulator [Conyzicola lurida]|uniref:DNA-binding IclR family transcriptional regulator n=1 Tax=Conyzicola lurida TaxID=1172621 RepID=A0A841AG21_9MICO|nr:IclR family transcriptional regulator [Conyzicola lurida]MBB5842187.1 DNA-binding IclR family transcriptional regulator [Conyzicola lurida]